MLIPLFGTWIPGDSEDTADDLEFQALMAHTDEQREEVRQRIEEAYEVGEIDFVDRDWLNSEATK